MQSKYYINKVVLSGNKKNPMLLGDYEGGTKVG